jgi:hypothetical protein
MKNVKKGLLFVTVIAVVFSAQLLIAGTNPFIEILSPRRGEEFSFGEDVVIAISMYDAEGDIDITSVELVFDNTDVTSQANLSAMLVVYSLEDVQDSGRHTFSIVVEDREGLRAELESFFNVAAEPKEERRITANGSIRTGVEYDQEASQETVGILDLNVYGNAFTSIDYDLSVEVTNEEASDKQRVSEFRLGLYSPLGGMVLGDTTPSFTDYTINGARVTGVHLFPQFGVFGLEFVYGNSLKEVKDPATQKQRVFASRMKIGREGGTLWGLSFVKVKDNVNDDIDPDPQENVVLGTDLTLSFFDGKFVIDGEVNGSLLNTNITDGAVDFEDNELPFDPENWEWLFTINENMGIPGQPNLAGKAGLRLGPFHENTLDVEVSYVGSSYYSLANTGIINDRAGVKAWDSLWLFQKRVYLYAAYQNYWDKLEGSGLEYRTRNTGYSGSVYVFPTDFFTVTAGVDIFNTFDTDRDYIDTMNATINGGVSQDLEILSTTSTLYGDMTASIYKDKAGTTEDTNDFLTRAGLISYFNSIPLDTKAVLGYDFGDTLDSFYVEGKAGYRFFKDETLYTFTDIIYETGSEQFDLTVGADYDGPFEIVFEAELEYITSPSYSDFLISAFATREF